MAKGTNKALLLGNVGKDPEIRSTNSGTIVATFSLATADRQKDSSGNWTDRTEWHNLVAFNRTAEVIRDYVKKGTQLFIEGKIQTRSWDDKRSGEKKYRTEILVDQLTLLGNRQGGGDALAGAPPHTNARQSSPSRASTTEEYAYASEGITDDDIPF
ncbi:MAG: single-stranded DNA-binding protein [Acidobacteriaceae bacterium]